MSEVIREEPSVVWTAEVNQLVGQVLTYIDAAISDPVQRKASKDLMTPAIWRWFNERPHLTTWLKEAKLPYEEAVQHLTAQTIELGELSHPNA